MFSRLVFPSQCTTSVPRDLNAFPDSRAQNRRLSGNASAKTELCTCATQLRSQDFRPIRPRTPVGRFRFGVTHAGYVRALDGVGGAFPRRRPIEREITLSPATTRQKSTPSRACSPRTRCAVELRATTTTGAQLGRRARRQRRRRLLRLLRAACGPRATTEMFRTAIRRCTDRAGVAVSRFADEQVELEAPSPDSDRRSAQSSSRSSHAPRDSKEARRPRLR